MSNDPGDDNADSGELSRYTDPGQPPPGFHAIACPDCSLGYLKPSGAAKAAAAGTQTGTYCTACGGRRWVWARLSH
ncbi:MAG TPA: hypothetical protein VE326_11290 [Candidatus Binatia bacterium]|nr:hypothetical protein [Candidatus Binatia bacterium]